MSAFSQFYETLRKMGVELDSGCADEALQQFAEAHRGLLSPAATFKPIGEIAANVVARIDPEKDAA